MVVVQFTFKAGERQLSRRVPLMEIKLEMVVPLTTN
jgi:hypothetical protein